MWLGPTPGEVSEKSLVETLRELDTTMYISTRGFCKKWVICVKKIENRSYRRKTKSII